jgi:hypothetical protein
VREGLKPGQQQRSGDLPRAPFWSRTLFGNGIWLSTNLVYWWYLKRCQREYARRGGTSPASAGRAASTQLRRQGHCVFPPDPAAASEIASRVAATVAAGHVTVTPGVEEWMVQVSESMSSVPDVLRLQRPDVVAALAAAYRAHFKIFSAEIYRLLPTTAAMQVSGLWHIDNYPPGVLKAKIYFLVSVFGVDLVCFTASPHSVKKVARYMVRKVGDLTWHYHAGIMTVPFQVAVRWRIPLIVWPEHYGELTGVFTLHDMVEFTKWVRQEHDMRGLEPEDIVVDPGSGITMADLEPYRFPTDEEIAQVGVRGIYVTNFLYWDDREQGELVLDKYNFEALTEKRDRTFKLFAKTDDHANDVHDYMKYLKFGYGGHRRREHRDPVRPHDAGRRHRDGARVRPRAPAEPRCLPALSGDDRSRVRRGGGADARCVDLAARRRALARAGLGGESCEGPGRRGGARAPGGRSHAGAAQSAALLQLGAAADPVELPDAADGRGQRLRGAVSAHD